VILKALRYRFSRSREPARRALSADLKPYQLYPEGSALAASFIARPRRAGVLIDRSRAVASMGSCFAREIKEQLVRRGFRYVQTEHNRWSGHASCSWERVYSVANACQILDYSIAGNVAPERFYAHGSKLFDLWRNKVAYDTREEAEADVARHVEASRTALERAELFILTLGQNEVWKNRGAGWFYATRPPGPLADSGEAVLTRLSVEENVRYLERFHRSLLALNPGVRLLVTLSPVPSLATFYDENVVQRSVWNKSILRAAIGGFLESSPESVEYFPSYEIVQCWRGNPFLADNRHVKPEVVDAIMESFFETFTGES
jgi:hypothetical protein